SGPFSAARIQARVDLAKCLRAHGVDVPDSVGTGGPAARAALQQLVAQYGLQGLVQKAQTDCKSNLQAAFPVFSLNPAQLAQRRQQALKFVQCLRSHGVSGLADPTSNGTIGAGLGKVLSTIDTNSPVFQSALKACQSERPTAIG
ncbi:MAG TPA: hypothetical protein VGX45_14020, partial [Solirubrobacteraceae bacterium]|nr:hypothetical protein [Solirubrobacteraceae bacterium]